MSKNMMKSIQIATSIAAISVFSSPLLANKAFVTDSSMPSAQQQSDIKIHSPELKKSLNSAKEKQSCSGTTC